MDSYRNKQTIATRAFGAGERTSTAELSASSTTEIIKIGNPRQKVSFQRSGTLQCAVSFSINGVDFQDTVNVTTAAIASYSTHVISYVKVVRSAGTGKLSLTIG